MKVREFLAKIDAELNRPELLDQRIAKTIGLGQEFSDGPELSALFIYLIGDKECRLAVVDTRCEEKSRR